MKSGISITLIYHATSLTVLYPLFLHVLFHSYDTNQECQTTLLYNIVTVHLDNVNNITVITSGNTLQNLVLNKRNNSNNKIFSHFYFLTFNIVHVVHKTFPMKIWITLKTKHLVSVQSEKNFEVIFIQYMVILYISSN